MITDLRKLEDEDVLLGTMAILGVPHHVHLIRVHVVDGVQCAVNDPYRRLDDLCLMDEDGGAFVTVDVPGFEGDYVVQVIPCSR